MTAIYKMNIWDTSINILRCLINIHYVYNALEHRMAIINRLIQAESSIVGRVLQDIQQSESNEMVKKVNQVDKWHVLFSFLFAV